MLKKLSIFIIVSITCYTSKADFEKIYAVMITGKDNFHKHLAEKSIQSFLEQTYPNKRLIIVNDGDYSFDYLNNESITEIKLKEKFVLGKLRNISLDKIPENSIYLQWDDDDWHHPDLMLEQYKQLKGNSADMCLLQNQILYAFKSNSALLKKVREPGIWGTIMCRKKNEIRYPEIGKSEDVNFVEEYKKYVCILWDNPEYYYLRFVHGYNTWDEAHFSNAFKNPNVWAISGHSRKYLSDVLPLYSFVNNAHFK